MEAQSYIDIAIVLILVLGAYEGYKQGFLLGILGLIGFVVAIVLGFYFMEPAAAWLGENVENVNLSYPVMGFLLIFFISLILIRVVGWTLKKLMDLTILGTFDAIGGIFFGVVKAGFFLSLFYWFTKEFDLDLPKKWERQSELISYVEPMAPFVIDALAPFFPPVDSTKGIVEEWVEKVRDAAVNR
ncbi:membrane protein required for colicin V production [Algoriphagus faecimaris]|uniref:Membrane protein required for colicin V production n=1 Tax=Algoriphagus faecimaris TaxID=686796 RepID=A0A1G6WN96_9BACT|nr:CvpA family protein [Algoriphagus faecimaris]SDD67352.1 membrane protein required for colicin V production [Algoriphagus faecimaris]